MKKYLRTFHTLYNYSATNHRLPTLCMQCDLYVTAVYFKRLSTENDYDTDCTGSVSYTHLTLPTNREV